MFVISVFVFQLHGEDVGRALEAALEAGYRHIDTAFAYRNEDDIGNVLNKWLTSGTLMLLISVTVRK